LKTTLGFCDTDSPPSFPFPHLLGRFDFEGAVAMVDDLPDDLGWLGREKERLSFLCRRMRGLSRHTLAPPAALLR
jgi:hypothetical protein